MHDSSLTKYIPSDRCDLCALRAAHESSEDVSKYSPQFPKMNPDPLPPNVVDSLGQPPYVTGESLFLQRIFVELRRELGDRFHEFTFVVHRWKFGERDERPISLDPGGPGRILILICDEKGFFPLQRFPGYEFVFRAYGKPYPRTTWHPFPIGYFEAAGKEVPISFEHRKNSVFFSGYLNRNRIDLYKQFTRLFWLPRRNLPGRHLRELARRIVEKFCRKRNFSDQISGSIIQFTEWFGKGLPPEEYARTLADTKIALCPPGFVSHETIRHWEAMRMGCVIISAPLPAIPFYEGSPIIQLEDWSELRPLLDRLLADPAELMKRHLAMREWWENVASEPAIARYMAGIIRRGRESSRHSAGTGAQGRADSA